MQIDMHYYGVYCLARAAGLNADAARIVATCSQFVDDNGDKEEIVFRDGGALFSDATAHHTIDLRSNLDRDDQRQVWVPFHFLPGNEGEEFTERLQCRYGTPIAEDLKAYALSKAGEDFGLHLLGIVAHIIADTYSHYGFSGVSSRRNKVERGSLDMTEEYEPEMKNYILGKLAVFFQRYKSGVEVENIKAHIAETTTGALGHAAVATYPDRPYLKWRFVYEYPERRSEERDNTNTFMAACRDVHALFTDFAGARQEFREQSFPFNQIEGTVRDILAFQGKKDDRSSQWRNAAADGAFAVGTQDEIPAYEGAQWLETRDGYNDTEDAAAVGDEDFYKFYQAARHCRTALLRDILPTYGIVVR